MLLPGSLEVHRHRNQELDRRNAYPADFRVHPMSERLRILQALKREFPLKRGSKGYNPNCLRGD